MKYYSAQDIREMIADIVGTDEPRGRPPKGQGPPSRSQKAVAKQLNVNEVLLSQFLVGTIAKPNDKILKGLGFKTTPYWRLK